MLVYLRKITSSDTNRQIETTSESYEIFFGGDVSNSNGIVVTMKNTNGDTSQIKVSKAGGAANSYRFAASGGSDTIKTLLEKVYPTGIQKDDILKIIKERQIFKLYLIKPEDSEYQTLSSMIIQRENTVIISEEVEAVEPDNGEQETVQLKSCLEISLNKRVNKVHPLNFIVYGAPGTGKTYSMVEYALAIMENKKLDEFRMLNTDRSVNIGRYKELVKNGQVVFTTFHQNYGYEEFIQGLRPDTDSEAMSFKIVDGVFKIIADKALNDADNKNYIIIIDEINRANISKVFGELITLIEEDKRWGELNEMSATLQSGDVFAVPNNLYIVGTMNSADKSISLIDAALRRRFDFIEQKPDSSLVDNIVLKTMLEEINLKLVEDLDSTDLLVGHSYFMNKNENDLCDILNNNIIPLLYEYFYDNRKKVANLVNEAIKKASAKIVIDDDKIGRLRVKDV